MATSQRPDDHPDDVGIDHPTVVPANFESDAASDDDE